MYSFDSRVRYSEVNCNCTMELNTLIDYFQDCSSFQSEDLGVGIEYYKNQGFAWLLTSWQIIVNRFPTFGEEITTSTWPYAFDRVYGYRNYMMKAKNGDVLAIANSQWIYVDIQKSHPIKLTDDITNIYKTEPKYDGMEYATRRLKLPENYTEHESFSVLMHHLDSNKHVNNGQYIKMAQRYLPDYFKIWQMRAEYKQQALLSDIIIPQVSIKDHICTIALVNIDKKPYCIIEFMSKADK